MRRSMTMAQEYFLGLDLGTGSLGWAVTTMDYEIMRAHGKALWGVRLFESAKTAEERRTFRTGRRRLARRNWRIELLQEIFAEEIYKVDPGFYLRMKESRYTKEDKRDLEGNCPELPYALFVDTLYTDQEYHEQFPTIYHLREWLMNTNQVPDIRLVYLALHHMMKHRGHFLFSGTIDSIKNFRQTFEGFLQRIREEELDFHIELEEEQWSEFENILKDKSITKSTKKTKLVRLTGAKTLCEKAVLNLIVGGTVKLSDIFADPNLNQIEKPKISFSDNSFEENSSNIETELGERFVIIEHAKAVYDWSILADILGVYTTISEAKVALYEKHKKDLQYLKKLVREKFNREVYQEIFVNTEDKLANYSAYIGMTKVNGKKCELRGKRCEKKEFYDLLKKKILKVIPEDQDILYLKAEIEKGTFLPRQVTKENGVIPYQLHLAELKRIIENLQECVPVLRENGDKICQIFEFRIPYYVGPLNGICKGKQTTNWLQRKKETKIYPWNFEEVVDREASAEQFIRRMTNKCTYLPREDVLPKNSMLYSKFMVLNELNNLCLNGTPISVKLKQKIYTDLFQRKRKVTQKALKNYLKMEGIVAADQINDLDLTGIDGDFKGSLTAYHDFKEKLTGCKLSDQQKEKIILDLTLFGDDKKLLKRRLMAMLPNLTDHQVKALCTLSYKGWGRLSRKFLEEIIAPSPETGETWSIIQALWESNDNLMQILSEKYMFAESVETENGMDEAKELTYQMVEQMAVSPAVKRQIWQTFLVVKELSKVLDNPPKRVFIEMAREKMESKRTISRKQKLMELYKKCREEERDWLQELNDTKEQEFRRDKLFLYYTQKGRCMYSGESIRLADLWDNQKYDIDHIYPQSKVMDDSLDNRVLVKREYNSDKTDDYPIADTIRSARKPFWKSLLDGGFITKEKYQRLTRATKFDDSELAEFIARQLVETRQGTKAVASILKQVLPETEIVYTKAKITSQFRQDFGFIKVRELNDLHHAKDAYLNIVVGNTYFTKFTKSAAWFIKKYPGRSYNLKKMFVSEDIVRNGEIAWRAGEKGTICTVRKVMNKNNILVTRRSYQQKGGLFDQQLMKKGKGQVPIKGNDERLCAIEKYGGYNKATGTYFVLVESEDKKGKKIRTIEYIPLYLCQQLESSEEEMKQYLLAERHLKNPKVLMNKIKFDTLFHVDGFLMWLSGRTGDQLLFKGANQLLLSHKEQLILKKVLKFVQRQKENKNIGIHPYDHLTQEDVLQLYDTFLNKIRNTVYHIRLSAQEKTLIDKRNKFVELSLEEKCMVLSEILHMFQCQSGSANLKLIGGPGSAGILVLNNNITNLKKISIINQSPTGIYQQEIDLKTL